MAAGSNRCESASIPINCGTNRLPEEDDTDAASVERKWKALDALSAEYDHLGSTPPRTRIRNKEKHRCAVGEMLSSVGSPKVVKFIRRNTTDTISIKNNLSSLDVLENKRAKRRSLKTLRGHERDLKLDIEKCKEQQMEQAPHHIGISTITKLVESNNRFKSLHSQPVCHSALRSLDKPTDVLADTSAVVDSRANFHNAFSMLIKMGNNDKNCKRTISMEEHTWQNELKDLIWLEVSARQAGRTATQQDAFLLSKRDIVPALLQNILDYKFVNAESKCHGSGVWTTQTSVTSPDSGIGNNLDDKNMFNSKHVESNNEYYSECLCVDCSVCSTAVGQAMREVENLLDLLSEAEALYPSTKAMAVQHPIIVTNEFINKTKAMCLWYNIVHHQRLKMLIIKKLLHKHKWKFSQKKIETSTQNFSECIGSKSTSEPKVKFTVEDSDKSPVVKCKNDNESDDDNDVKQSSMIHIKITGAKLDSNASEDETEQSSRDSTKSADSQVQIEKSLLNVRSFNSKCDSANVDETPDTPNSEHSRSPYESADSSVGSMHSNESGFMSSVTENHDDSFVDIVDFNVYNMGSLGDLTKLRLYNPNLVSPYRDYIEKMLKVRGLRRALYFLEKLHLGVLKKARMTLEKFKEEIVHVDESNDNVEIESEVILRNYYNVDSSDDDFEYERHTRCEVDFQELKKECVELRRYGAWSRETLDMCLPSYRSIFLFLSTVPLENIHEFLLMRLETKPEKPSALSIKQLIYELREGLAIAVRLRSRFIRHVDTALVVEPKESKHRMFYEKVLSTFNNTLNEIYKLYLSYLSDWAGMEHLPRTILSNEWTFNYYLAQRLKSAATIAPLTFCCLTVRQLEGAADRLKKRVAELRQKTETFIKNESPNNSIKLCILRVCRDMQCLLSEERERALSTAQFARIVSKHLDHNVVFREYRQKIYKAMACVQNILCWTIDQMQQATEPERLFELDECDRPSVQSRTREIVSQGYKFGFEFHKEMCRLINDDSMQEGCYNPYARNSISTYRKSRLTRADSINLDNSQYSIDENYAFVPYTPTSNQEFVYTTYSTKPTSRKQSRDEEALTYSLCGRRISSEKKYSFGKDQKFNTTISNKELAELKLEDFQNGIPGCESCNKLLVCEDLYSGMRKTLNDKDGDNCDWEVLVSSGLVQFAKQWMDFAMKRCERGRGLRPRWANHGLEFLMLTCDPQHTKHLSDAEFEELKYMMDNCISHVIGSSRGVPVTNNIISPTIVGTPPIQRVRTSSQNSQNPFSNKVINSTTPPTPPVENNTHLYSYETDILRLKKKLLALKELDCKRDDALRKVGAIGTVRQGTGSRDHFRPRPVTFKWQRGIKIGQGRFGKVYTVVNTESGQLLAMKEVSLGIGDRRAVDRAANELQVLEGVVHPNLVRYYGVEIHREEMLIFMELCVEGSLENMIAGCSNTSDDGVSCNGLPEQLIRRYTSQLVSAVKALHDRSIAHRDIKSGNIFLTDGGNCLKLGDFGCAVKIRANTTVPGELQGYIGTQAYMAPEVFMKSSGHGRAADIWSLGCVVVEMASGKHPWSEYDSNYQIMFVVGMGNRPEIPPSLSTEGTDFCLVCLQHDPIERASAEKLSHHHFLKVNRTEYY